MIRAVVIDDSPTAARAVAAFLRSDPRFGEVVTASDPATAAAVVARAKPDVATLDLEMPAPGGLSVLETVMNHTPTPIVVVTGVSRAALATTLQACELGAVDFLLKYAPGRDTDPDTFRRELIGKVVAAAGVRLFAGPQRSTTMPPHRHYAEEAAHSVLVIGASTGGPSAIRELLAELPREFPAAIVIAQHLPAGFTQAFAAQLARVAPGPVREARSGDLLSAGVTFLAPGGYHTSLRPDGRLAVFPVAAAALSPSVDVLIASVAERYGSQLHAVILSGMGSDGVDGLAAARALGAETYAQDPRSCVIAGMPERAIARGAVAHIACPQEIGRLVAFAFGGIVPRNSLHG